MNAYVDIDFVKLVGSLPAEDIDLLEEKYPGLFDKLSKSVSRYFDSRLTKRYDVEDMHADPPEGLKWEVAHYILFFLWKKRGFNPGSAQDQLIIEDKKHADDWLKEAADSKDGLIELPKKEADGGAGGITRGGPLGYSETSPYVWMDRQEEDGRNEDFS